MVAEDEIGYSDSKTIATLKHDQCTINILI